MSHMFRSKWIFCSIIESIFSWETFPCPPIIFVVAITYASLCCNYSSIAFYQHLQQQLGYAESSAKLVLSTGAVVNGSLGTCSCLVLRWIGAAWLGCGTCQCRQQNNTAPTTERGKKKTTWWCLNFF